MTVFLLAARVDGSIQSEALGALRRSSLVLTITGATPWVRSWVGATSQVVVEVRDVPELLRRADAHLTGGGTVGVVLPPGGDAGPVRSALRFLSPVRDVGVDGEPSILDGGIVEHGDLAGWVAGRPLLGWHVMVTRPEHENEALGDLLAARGARPLMYPVTRLLPLEDSAGLDRVASSVDDYHWIVFTSSNAVSTFGEALLRSGRDARDLAGCRIAVIGSATAQAVERLGLRPDVVPAEFVAESLLSALEGVDQWEGRRVLLPRATEARDVIPQGLTSWGALVDVVPAYRSTVDRRGAEEARGLLDSGQVDIVTFTASSAVRAFRSGIGGLGLATGVAIGPITAATATEEDIRLAAVATESTMEGLVRACETVASAER